MKQAMTNDEMQICDKAFQKMNDQFSSRQFNKALRFFGLSDSFIDQDKAYYYLKMNCRIVKGKRTWIKNDSKSFFDDIIEKNLIPIENQINDAIELLKSTGKYKIYFKEEKLVPIN